MTSDLQVVTVTGTPLTFVWVTSSQGAPAAVPQAKISSSVSSNARATRKHAHAHRAQTCAHAGLYSHALPRLCPPKTTTTQLEKVCTTDADGVCATNGYRRPDDGEAVVTVQAAGHGNVSLFDLTPGSPTSNDEFIGKLVLDRAFVRPGEKLYVTGYVQRRADADLALVNGVDDVAAVTLRVSPNPDPKSKDDSLVVPAALYLRYGSLRPLAVALPDNADLITYDVQLRITTVGDLEDLTLDYASFTAADPRPPTATVNLTAPAWVSWRFFGFGLVARGFSLLSLPCSKNNADARARTHSFCTHNTPQNKGAAAEHHPLAL